MTVLAAFLILILFLVAGCGYEPDVSAPERIEIERSSDWRGALLYIADESGPNPEFGSVRIYDNVSGLVEKSVEQVSAALPTDVFVTPEGSSMFVSSGANGLIDKFRWDGNNWISGGITLEPEATAVLALRLGPDGKIYAVDGSPGVKSARLFVFDPLSDRLVPEPVIIGQLAGVSGISWSSDGLTSFIAGTLPESPTPVLAITPWPSAQPTRIINLPLETAHQAIISPDGADIYVMGRGQIVTVDPISGEVNGSMNPEPGTDVDYVDGDFSADGGFLFVTARVSELNGILYVIDLKTGALVNKVENIGVRIGGIQRVE